MNAISAYSLSRKEVEDLCSELGVESYRSKQLWQWLYTRGVQSWDGMKNLPSAMRKNLTGRMAVNSLELIKADGGKGGTRKLLLKLQDGEYIEEVLIPAGGRRTVCVSSQVGCRFHCAFCASGQAGFRRNLDTGEIVGQVMVAGREYGEKPTNVVFMGIGEPMDNYDAVLKAVRIINHGDGLNIGARKITISTSGVIPGIERLAGEGIQVELSVSLHAPSDALRSKLMPVNRKYPLKSLLKVCRDYALGTKRIITFEYVLIKDVNDSVDQAGELGTLLKDIPSRVNLIPLSGVTEFRGEPSSRATAGMFMRRLEEAGINTTLRDSRGGEWNAACGQLRARHL